ncbi:MAG: response regulator, partial [Pseudomonadales bacterium]|nr:response regulator [Pseudomonadales bacterium]
KAETNELDLNPIPCRLQSLVPELNSVFAQKFEEKGIAFDIEVDPFLPTCVRTDPLRFKQIVFNLVSNALKFTFNGQVKVSITLQEENIIDSEAYVLVSVSDTGVGMAPEIVDMLFAPFVNLGEGSESGPPRSTGLGLALSSHLAKLMQGDIRVESRVGQGTVFTFRAKLPVLEDLSLVSSNEVPLTTQTLAADISNRRILLVDDLEVNRVIVEDFLLSMGMQVEIASDGHEAVEKVRQDNFNLVLMDVHMPVLDGYAAAYRIRNELGDRNLPIVALTANVQEQVKEKCLQAGMNDFIAKPVKQEELLEKVLFWTSSPYHAKALASSGAVNTP